MSRRGESDEPFLFDLPLVAEEEGEAPGARRPAGARGGAEARGGAGDAGDAAPPFRGAGPGGEPGARAERGPVSNDEELPLFAPDPFAEHVPGRATAEPDETGFPFGERPPPHRAAPHRAAAHPLAPAADPAGWDVVAVAGVPDEEGGVGAAPPAASPAAAAAVPLAAGLAPRLGAAAVDGAVLAAVAALAFVGAVLLDLRPGLAALPGLVALLLVFSFAYSVVPLAFWGATPGMSALRLVARDRDGGPLTFGQTALRWLAGLLTVLLAGLPLLLALGFLGGRSPADRMSRSLTWRRRP